MRASELAPEPASHLSKPAREFLTAQFQAPPTPDLDDHTATTAMRQAALSRWLHFNDTLPGLWVSRSETVAGVPAVRFAADEPAFDREPVIVHLHGGAFVLGAPMASAGLIVPVAQRTGLTVLSVDYRLAPEHPFPAAVDDAAAVCERLSESRRLAAVYGESAGACLALAAAVRLRDGGAALPRCLGLLSPWVDLTCSGDSYRTLAHADPVLGALDPHAFAAAYAAGRTSDPQASPLFADLTDLPPTMIQVGGREILLSDACRLHAAMRQAGADARLDVSDGMWHGWQLRHDMPEAVRALDELAEFITSHVGGPVGSAPK